MLYVFYGNDAVTRGEKAHALIEGLLQKKPDASFERYDEESFDTSLLPELAGGQGLFSQAKIVLLAGIAGQKESWQALRDAFPVLSASQNIVVISEGSLDASAKKACEKYAQKVVEVSQKSDARAENPFAITEALASRDKKKLWLLYSEEREKGAAPEEIHGRLVWQMKALLVAGKTSTPEEAGMKAYPYKKAKSALRKWPEEELLVKYDELVRLYHDAHRGKRDFEVGLEGWCLGV